MICVSERRPQKRRNKVTTGRRLAATSSHSGSLRKLLVSGRSYQHAELAVAADARWWHQCDAAVEQALGEPCRLPRVSPGRELDLQQTNTTHFAAGLAPNNRAVLMLPLRSRRSQPQQVAWHHGLKTKSSVQSRIGSAAEQRS